MSRQPTRRVPPRKDGGYQAAMTRRRREAGRPASRRSCGGGEVGRHSRRFWLRRTWCARRARGSGGQAPPDATRVPSALGRMGGVTIAEPLWGSGGGGRDPGVAFGNPRLQLRNRYAVEGGCPQWNCCVSRGGVSQRNRCAVEGGCPQWNCCVSRGGVSQRNRCAVEGGSAWQPSAPPPPSQ